MADLNNDRDLEQYLKRFQPRAVRPLDQPLDRPIKTSQPNLWLRWAVASAAIVIAVITIQFPRKISEPRDVVHGLRSSTSVPAGSTTIPALTRLALDDQSALDRVLADQSRAAFPNMQQERSALTVLGKEKMEE